MRREMLPGYHCPPRAGALADWLEESVDSHGVYETSMLHELTSFNLYYDASSETIRDPSNGKTAKISVQTAAQVRKEIEARGLGGWLNTEYDGNLVAGWRLASLLDSLVTGEDAGWRKHGRGSAFRENVEHLRSYTRA